MDYRSDQFSFGSILCEMATSKTAFSRETVTETLAAVMRDEPEPVGNLNPTLPAPLKWIIERCIAKDREERYGTTRDLAHELENLRDHLADVTSAPSVLPEPKAIGKSRRAMTLFGVGALVVILGLIVGLNVGGLRERLFGGGTSLNR